MLLMRLALLLAVGWVASPVVFGQAKAATAHAPAADRDQLGFACPQILERSSADWVAQFNAQAKESGSEQQKTLRAIAVYGKCYDARTDRMARSLGKKGSGPLMGARANFRDFEQAVQIFTTKALAATDPPPNAVKTAYAGLYEKQFRYQFYAGPKTPGATSPAQEPYPPKTLPLASSLAPSAQASTAAAADDMNPVTMAKNHFGELLNSLPEDKVHELHSAFGDIVSRGELSEATRLAAYHYAIFLLEPASEPPFSPPPF
jgi:hypothetical protein